MRASILVLALCGSALAAPVDIGTAAAVIPDAQGTLEGTARALKTGSRIHASERITSGAAGRLQLLFRDGTSLNVGSGSDLVLDRYVYDPERGTGEMATSMSKGVLRFVGGRISKRKKVTVETPVGTVGIRGGIAAISYEPGGELVAALLYGDALTVSAGGITRSIDRPGLALRVSKGGPPSKARRMAPGELGRMMKRMSSRGPGGPGGPGGPAPARFAGKVAGFGSMASMVAPLPGRPMPGAPSGPGGHAPGIGGPLGQPPPGGAGPGPGAPAGAPPPGMLPPSMEEEMPMLPPEMP